MLSEFCLFIFTCIFLPLIIFLLEHKGNRLGHRSIIFGVWKLLKSIYCPILLIFATYQKLTFLTFIYQNGSLLRKYTYLNNDSSYSITIEDGVEIVAPCNLTSGDEKSLDNLNQTSGTTIYSQYESNGTQSFTLETQVNFPSCFQEYYS